ncbi:MAG: carboxypeptidase-like regulatory domain-containing protein, partial [Gemmatimonadota bacterium]|nr:carboxypeptidase-like regulatory domain-containing protein [Gemmatimonadota bacterium]
MRRTFVLTVLAGVLTASTLSAQEREIRGRVTGAPSGAGLADALVDVVGAQYQAVSDRTGSFVIRAPSGEVRLRVSLLGYTTTEVVVGASQSDVQILMDQDVLNITGVVVTGRATSVQRRN